MDLGQTLKDFQAIFEHYKEASDRYKTFSICSLFNNGYYKICRHCGKTRGQHYGGKCHFSLDKSMAYRNKFQTFDEDPAKSKFFLSFLKMKGIDIHGN